MVFEKQAQIKKIIKLMAKEGGVLIDKGGQYITDGRIVFGIDMFATAQSYNLVTLIKDDKHYFDARTIAVANGLSLEESRTPNAVSEYENIARAIPEERNTPVYYTGLTIKFDKGPEMHLYAGAKYVVVFDRAYLDLLPEPPERLYGGSALGLHAIEPDTKDISFGVMPMRIDEPEVFLRRFLMLQKPGYQLIADNPDTYAETVETMRELCPEVL